MFTDEPCRSEQGLCSRRHYFLIGTRSANRAAAQERTDQQQEILKVPLFQHGNETFKDVG
jgi:hypothetical protein